MFEPSKTYFIADIAANHDGDLSRAKDLIHQAKAAGADAAKFQNFKAQHIVSDYGFNALGKQLAHQAKWKKSVVDVYRDAELSLEWTQTLKGECDKAGIDYFTSPYDQDSVDAVDPYVPAYKIGSGDITFHQLIRYICQKNKPVILATGAATFEEVVAAVQVMQQSMAPACPLGLMQCNTNYTGSIDNFNYIQLNVLKLYQLVFPDAILGLSDHTPGHATVLGAVALGARLIEKHFTDDTGRQGPDHGFSMDPKTFRDMVDRTRELEMALGQPFKQIEPNEVDSSVVQKRALYVTRDIAKGDVLKATDLEALRPVLSDSFKPFEDTQLLGKQAPKAYQAGECPRRSDGF